MGVVEGDQQRLGGHLSQPVQDGVQTIGGRLIARPRLGPRAEHLATEQRFQGLAEQPEGQGRFGHIRPSDPDGQAAARQLDRAFEQGGLAEAGLTQYEESSPLARHRALQDGANPLQGRFPLGQGGAHHGHGGISATLAGSGEHSFPGLRAEETIELESRRRLHGVH